MNSAEKAAIQESVLVSVEGGVLQGLVTMPENPAGIIVLGQPVWTGSAHSRYEAIVSALTEAGMATVVVDLLAFDEDREMRFNINSGLLTRRLIGVVRWVRSQDRFGNLPLGLYAASIGAPAAIHTAVAVPGEIKAMVLRSAYLRPAESVVSGVACPTLLVARESDYPFMLDSNRKAFEKLTVAKGIAIMKEDMLKDADALAAAWFARHMRENGDKRNQPELAA